MAKVEVDEVAGGIRIVTLNDPDRLNPLSQAMIHELSTALAAIDSATDVRAVVLTGAGRGFCAGADLTELGTAGANGHPAELPRNPMSQVYLSQQELAMVHERIHRMRVPVIAAVNGVAAGGGFTLTLACDLRVAAASARFTASFIKLGISGADMGSSYFLPRLLGPMRALELMSTGRMVAAEEAHRLGLVLDISPDGSVVERAVELARQITAHAPFAVWMTKQTLWQNVDAAGLHRAMELENRTQTMCFGSGEMQQAAVAFVTGQPVEAWRPL